jgi:hypothetical protein
MTQKKKLKIGLVMPIAPIDGLDSIHWVEVKKIISDALDEIELYEFETKIVSEGDSVGLIHKRIVQGLYTNDIVICDVSCKNPNVMLELGMRLAFDKPTVIIKDDKTNFTFDAGVIEHLEYPRDLRFTRIVDFKRVLATKVIATYEDSQSDPGHSPFLKSFGDFTSVKIEETEVSGTTEVLKILSELQSDVQNLKAMSNKSLKNDNFRPKHSLDKLVNTIVQDKLNETNDGDIVDFSDILSSVKSHPVSMFYTNEEINSAITKQIRGKAVLY